MKNKKAYATALIVLALWAHALAQDSSWASHSVKSKKTRRLSR